MGSDLSYEDMTSRKIEEYSFKITSDNANIEGKPCYILESTPDGVDSEYSQHTTWVDKNTYLALKEESYDKSGKLLKLKTFKYKLIDSYQLIEKIFVENVQKKSNTVLRFEDIIINTGIQDQLFEKRNMKKKPPKIKK